MAKGRVSKMTKKEESLLSKSISPLLIAITICVLVYVGHKVYTAIQTGIRSAQENLKRKGFTVDEKGQAHVKVKTVDSSSYVDKTQRAFVNAWNNSETRGYYSRLWSKQDLRDKQVAANKVKGNAKKA